MSIASFGGPIGSTVILSTASSLADEVTWHGAHDDGWGANQEGRIAEAEMRLRSAAKEVRAFHPGDPRVATPLGYLASASCARGKFADAEPLARWAIAAREERLGAGHHEAAESRNIPA